MRALGDIADTGGVPNGTASLPPVVEAPPRPAYPALPTCEAGWAICPHGARACPRGALSCNFDAAPQRVSRTGPRPPLPNIDAKRTPALRPRPGSGRIRPGRHDVGSPSDGDVLSDLDIVSEVDPGGDGDTSPARCGDTTGGPTRTTGFPTPAEAGATPRQQLVDPTRLGSGNPTRELRGLILRYFLTVTLVDSGREVTVRELCEALAARGCATAGRTSKVISDALRWEVRRGRVQRTGRGRYAARRFPRQTLGWMRARLAEEWSGPAQPVRPWPVGLWRVGWSTQARGRELRAARDRLTVRRRADRARRFARWSADRLTVASQPSQPSQSAPPSQHPPHGHAPATGPPA